MSHYLDHAATTPMRRVAREAWLEATGRLATGEWGNPSSLHAAGRAARAAVEDARERIAAALGAHPTEVIFTAGATEANNLALKGWFWGSPGGGHTLITSAVEHHAALDPARWLAREHGLNLIELPVGPDARVNPDDLLAALEAAVGDEAVRDEAVRDGADGADGADSENNGAGRPGPHALVSIQWVNNETGTIQPLAEVASAAGSLDVPVHSDAAQAVAHLPVDFAASGLTTMAVSAHKLGGPVGIGALVARRDARLTPVEHGGGQERRLRSGTVDVADALAFAAALEATVHAREAERARLTSLRDRLEAGIEATLHDAHVTRPADPAQRAPHIVHLVIAGAPSEALLFLLDQAGIAASSGSACTAGVVDASHVALAMGHDAVRAAQTLRLSLGHTSTEADVDAVLAVLPDAVAKARASAG